MKKVKRDGYYYVGDRVEITGYSEDLNGQFGFITRKLSPDVFYVRPRWSKHEYEIYGCELRTSGGN